jgi:hypothetical protein
LSSSFLILLLLPQLLVAGIAGLVDVSEFMKIGCVASSKFAFHCWCCSGCSFTLVSPATK